MSEEKVVFREAKSLRDIVESQRKRVLKMVDKSGRGWAIEVMPLPARDIDAVRRQHPIPARAMRRDPKGAALYGESGEPLWAHDPANLREIQDAYANQLLLMLAIAIGPDFFGTIVVADQTAKLSEMFGPGTLNDAGNTLLRWAGATAPEKEAAREEAREQNAPFGSTAPEGESTGS